MKAKAPKKVVDVKARIISLIFATMWLTDLQVGKLVIEIEKAIQD